MQWESEIFCQLTSFCRQTSLGAILEQTVMNFKNPAHGFCAKGFHIAEWQAVFENFAWFESIFGFSDHEEGIFRDGRFTTVGLDSHWGKKKRYLMERSYSLSLRYIQLLMQVLHEELDAYHMRLIKYHYGKPGFTFHFLCAIIHLWILFGNDFSKR